MSSFRRIISSRANAALSAGPRSPAGLSRYETTQDLNFYRAYRNRQDLRHRKAEPKGQPKPSRPSAKSDVENKICTNEATLGFFYTPGPPHPTDQTRGQI